VDHYDDNNVRDLCSTDIMPDIAKHKGDNSTRNLCKSKEFVINVALFIVCVSHTTSMK
jgi:hypothetical protein